MMYMKLREQTVS